MAPREPGLFRKGKLKLCVYVDDSLITGPNLKELQQEMKVILDRFPGKIIPASYSSDDPDT